MIVVAAGAISMLISMIKRSLANTKQIDPDEKDYEIHRY
jgi:hypothetical protein